MWEQDVHLPKGRRSLANAVARGLVRGWKDHRRHEHHKAIEVASGIAYVGHRNVDRDDLSQHHAHPSMWVPAGLHMSANVITLKNNRTEFSRARSRSGNLYPEMSLSMRTTSFSRTVDGTHSRGIDRDPLMW